MQPIEDMFDHPQVLDQDLVATFDHPVVGRYRGFQNPLHLSRTPGPPPFAAPAFGEHTAQVLRAHGFSDAEVATLEAQGAVRQR